LVLAAGSTDGFGFDGTVTVEGVPHALDAQRMPIFNRANPAPEAGAYTVVVRAPDGVDPASAPGGDGYGVLTVSVAGACSGRVTLADGTSVTLGGHVARRYDDGGTWTSEWSVHRGLYGRTPKGFLAGKLSFRAVADISDVDGAWRWVKQAGAVPVGGYPVIDSTREVLGARYVAPLAGIRAMDGLDDAFYNVWLRFAGPNLGAGNSLDRAGTWTTANRILFYGPERFALGFHARSGLLTGSYTDAVTGVNLRFGGVLLQSQNLISGSYRQAVPLQSGLFAVEAR
jgi:hypothetical protein